MKLEKENRSPNGEISSAPQAEVTLGTLVGFDEIGLPLVDWPSNKSGIPQQALSVSHYSKNDIGRTAAMLFSEANRTRPVIVGLIHEPLDEVVAATDERHQARVSPNDDATEKLNVEIDGKRTVVQGTEEVVLRCGEASITLTKAGKVILRGAYILSRSTGSNRIKGGSVMIN